MLLRLAVIAAVACALTAHTTHHHSHEDAKPDCLKAGDGYYVAGCSSKFWRCVNDRLYNYDCPKGLYFNPLKRKCEYKADVPICTPGVKVDSKNVIKASAEFNCTALADGPYKPRDIACSNTFITCFSGMAVEQACPFGQFFHEQNKQCDYKDNVPGCLQSGVRGSKIGASIGADCAPLRSGHVNVPCDSDEVCQKIDAPEDGRYLCPAPFAVWYGPLGTDTSDQWTIATEGLRCGEDGRWYNGHLIVSTPAVDCTAKKSALAGQDRSYGSAPAPPPQRSPAVSVNAKAAALKACPGMVTGKESEGIPCAVDELCQGIQRPKNGRYFCEAPFSVWYGPVRGSNDQWKQAAEALVCGADGFWYDSGVKVEASGIDCTAKKSAFEKKANDDQTSGCPSLSTNDREIPCKGDEEVCQPILKAVAGKYACPTPYRVWYGPRSGAEADWKQAKDALICKSGSWFDGDVKIDATAVDCTVKKIDCSKLGDGTYNGEPGRCSTHFWQCSNEQAYLYPCAPGLFFDDFSKQCEYKEVVESCGGVRRSPAAATTTTAAPMLAADAPKKTDCSAILTDSTLPCKKDDACVAPADPVNQKYLCDTPYALWFGPKSNADQWRQAPNGIQCKNGQWFNGEEQIAPEAVHCTTPKFACAGKKDGSYSAHADKCTSYFWNCAHDDAFLYTCPAGLFFDVDSLSCDYKEVIVACGGVKKDAVTVAPAAELVPRSDAIKASFDCAGKDNGYHEDGKCQKKFWNCADGKTFTIDCPEGLVYDGRVQLCQYPAACDADLPVTTTPAVPPSTLDHGDISQKPALPTTSFDCATQPDGLYAEKKCHKQYVQCTNGRTFAKECPAGLVYTAFKQNCDYKQICMNPPVATTVAPSTTTAAPQPAADAAESAYATYERTPVTTTTTTQAPVAPLTFDKPNCANLEDGAHAMARCGQDFFLCWQGEATFSKCNEGLIFNTLNSQCDYRSNVLECDKVVVADAITAAPSGQAAPPAPPTTPIPDLFCEGRGDGHFGSGCQSFFYSCQGGVTTKMFCPVGLHYDAEAKTCDLRELIVACGGKKEESASSTTTTTSPYAFVPLTPTAAASKDMPMPPRDDFCAGKDSGFYTDGCQKYFYSCQNGLTYKMVCASDLYYDPIEKACNHRESIVICGATRATTTTTQAPTTPAADPTTSSYYLPIAPVASAQPAKDIPVVVNVERFCAGKPDAFYGDGCQTLFYSCQNGVTYKMDCPAGLYYDADAKKCDRREEIVACGAAPTTTQAPVTKAADVPVVPIGNFCDGKTDGFYSLGCASFFYSCQNGATYKMTCPSGLYYDLAQKSCLNKEEIVACTAAPATTTQTPAAAPARTTVAPAPYAAKAADIPVVLTENVCVGKTNSVVGAGCQNVFYNCYDGVSYKTTCAEGLFFDVDTGRCNYKEAIVSCGGKAQEATVTPVVPALDRPSGAVDNFCLVKEDGFYGVGCETFFYSCQAGVSYKMACPVGLYYEQESKHCDRKDQIALCRVAPATSAPSIALAPTQSAYSTAPTAAPIAPSRDQQVIPLITNENFCTGKVDGFYGDNGCAGHFFSCSNGLTAKMLCPAGLFYDVSSKQCDNRDDVVACGGVAKTVTPVVPAASPAMPAMPAVPAVVPASPYAQQPAPTTTTTATPVRDVLPIVSQEKYCVGKVDGVYTNGCDNFYYSCVNQLTYKMACPGGLFYEISKSVCDIKENVVACGGKPAVVNPVAPPAHAQPVPTVDAFCLGKADGFYGLGCAGHFYSCNNAYTYKMLCPSGLFYDLATKACNNREKVASCGALTVPVAPVAPVAPIAQAPTAPQYMAPVPVVPAATAPLVPTSTLPFDAKFCPGKANGIYTVGCASWYYNCANGYTYKMVCGANNLFYDVANKRCDMKENVAACGGQPQLAPPQTQPTITAPVKDAVPVANFCSGKTDGIYTEGCAEFYYNCQNGYTHKMPCPSGLFYDLATKACNNREKVASCGALTVPVAPVAPVAQAPTAPQYMAPVPVVPAATAPLAPTSSPAFNAKFCSGKANGIYTVGCSSWYYNCANGYTYKMVCGANNLFYDVANKRCDMKENVAACGGQPQLLAPPQTQYGPAPTITAPVKDAVPVANFCSGKTDGIYTEGCAEFYYNCQNGYTHKMPCPSGLFYNGPTKRCEMRDVVVACGAQQLQPQILPLPRQQPQSQYNAPTTTPVRDATPVNKFCSGKADGIYTEGCTDFYYNCQNGYTYKMACPAGLFYNVPSKTCEQKENVVACGGQQPQPQILPMPQQQQPQPQTQYQPAPAPVAPVRDVVAPVVNFCSGKIDGIYTEGCADFYYNCQNGYTNKMACPAGLFYNGPSKRCEMKENVIACGGQQLQQQPQPQTQYQPAPAPVAPVRDVAAPVVNFCSGKVDGIYTEGCADFYYNCQNGYTHKMACPAGLFYNGPSKRCEQKENVIACGGQQPQQQQPQTQYQPAPAPVAPVRDVVAPVVNFCSGKTDGIYTEGCADFYYNCQNGYTHKMACPAGLFYNGPSKRCEQKENVVACGGQQPQPQILPMPQQQQPQSQYHQPAPAAPAKDTVAVHSFCAGKADGQYSDGCKTFFYYCSNAATFKMECSAGLYYDVTRKQCERKETIVACGGVAPAAAPAAPGYNAPSVTAAPAASYSRPATAPVKDTGVTEKTCVGKENVYFGEGCNSFFHACINGKTYKMACPTGLFFDTELQSCEYRDSIPNCGGKRVDVAPTPSPALDVLPPAPVSSDKCAGKTDGFYAAADCSGDYIACQAGLLRKEACQPGLFYNEVNGMCDWRENIAKCAGARDTLPTRAPATAEYGRTPSRPITGPAKYDSHKEEQQKPRKPALSPSGASCSGQADGYYSSGCSADYTACINGEAMAMHCPSDLKYSASTLMCDYEDNVPECGGSTPNVAKDISPRPTIAPVVPVTPKTYAPAQAPAKEVHPRCAGRANGIYALAPCSQNYLACVDEKANIGRCREDLFYSTTSGLCDWQDKITACNILVVRPTPVTRSIPSTTPVPIVPVNDVVRPTGDRLIRPTVPLGFQPDCSKIADGVYAINACSPHYTRCAGGRITAHGTCPVNTFFSAARSGCLDKSNFPACAAPPVATSSPTQAPAFAPAQPQTNYGVQPAQQQPQQPMYNQQQQQPTYQQQAPQPMNYQQPQQYNQQQQQYAPSYSASYGSDIYADPTQFCYSRPDGIYGNTCQKSYIICTRGATLNYVCPNDFVFIRARAVCDHPTRIAECGAAPAYGYTAQAAPPAYQQQQGYGYTATAPQSYQQQQSYSNY